MTGGTTHAGVNQLSPPLTIRPRAAYVHVPFCARRCGYCNFTLVAGRGDLIEQYLQAIEIELSALGQPREVDTLFFGGGTPTQLRGKHLDTLLDSVLAWHPLAPGGEFSVEANPADLDADMVRQLADRGATRISLGAQSFQEKKLRVLERDHTAEQIRRSVRWLRDASLTVSLDLIFGAPGEKARDWQADLQSALTLDPEHISTYGLTFERGAAFWGRLKRGEIAAAPEELERGMYAAAIDSLTAHGFEHYEVSNFARPGRRCRHNETYWSGDEYFAVGPGASRYVNGARETNHRSTTIYLKRVLGGKSPVAESEQLSSEDRARELLVFGLRRIAGVERQWFHCKSGFDLDTLAGETIAKHVALGTLEDNGHRIRLTSEGLFISDAIWPDLLIK